jgi:hypothetical protein
MGLPRLIADPLKKPLMGLGVSDKPCAEHALPISLSSLVVERKPSMLYGGHHSLTKFDALVGEAAVDSIFL